MLSIIISSVASIISGMVLFLLQHYIKKRYTEDSKTKEENNKKDILIMKSLNALGKLAVSNSNVLKNAQTEGEAKTALNEYSKVNNEMMDFLIENSAKEK